MKHQTHGTARRVSGMAKSFLAFAAVLGLTAVVHEYGHVSVCVLDGFSYEIDILALKVTCEGLGWDSSEVLWLHYMSGGLLAAAASLVPLAWPRIRRSVMLKSSLLTAVAAQLANALIETYAHTWYIVNIGWLQAVMMAFAVAMFVMFLSVFGSLSNPGKAPFRHALHKFQKLVRTLCTRQTIACVLIGYIVALIFGSGHMMFFGWMSTTYENSGIPEYILATGQIHCAHVDPSTHVGLPDCAYVDPYSYVGFFLNVWIFPSVVFATIHNSYFPSTPIHCEIRQKFTKLHKTLRRLQRQSSERASLVHQNPTVIE